ncbi:MAG: 16S rRNA processing protein RimM [Candidatus Omnitrophota bacterium]|jgi:16S rRNA processing protein RimM|nr:MAG: 16S rRNA processing protein RimM [Candidatus Omnitrophota bacterium]
MTLRRKKEFIRKDRIYLGKIIKPHSLQGEVKFNPFQCDPWLLATFATIHNEKDDTILDVEYVRGCEHAPIVKFKGIDDRPAAESLTGSILWIEESCLPELEENQFYESDFLFSQVRSTSGEMLGRIEEIIETGESDVLVIRDTKGKEILLPATLAVVKEIRKEESLIIVEPLVEEPAQDGR